MESHCSCGARLVADAQFCHRCGKPTFERPELDANEPEIADEPAPPPAPASQPEPAAQKPLPIGFRNVLAVRVSVLAASLMYLLSTVATMMTAATGVPAMQFLVMIASIMAAGGYAAYLYQRAGQPIPSGGGARIGWMTGIFAFVLSTILFTVAVALMAGEGGFAAFYQRNLEAMNLPSDTIARMKELFENPPATAVLILLVLGLQFMFMTLLAAAGGALGARFLERRR